MVITVWRRGRSGERELVEMQVGKFRSDQIHVTADVIESVLRSDWEAGSVGQARVEESALAVHLKVCDKSIPVGH